MAPYCKMLPLITLLLLSYFLSITVSNTVDPDYLKTIFTQFASDIENDKIKFEKVEVKSEFDCAGNDYGHLLEATIPWEFEEGTGYINVRRIGAMVSKGGEDLQCYNVPAHLGPPNSYMKGYWARVIDTETKGPVGYPPIHLHHSIIQLSPRNFIGRRGGGSDRVCETYDNILGNGRTLIDGPDRNGLYRNIMDCSLFYQPRGIGYFIPENPAPHGEVMTLEFVINDVREAGSPAFKIGFDTYSFWLTDVKPDVTMRSAYEFEQTTSTRRDGQTTYLVPLEDDGIAFSSFAMRATGHLYNLAFHIHMKQGDESWLMRGAGADLLDIPTGGQNDPYHYIINSTCKKNFLAAPEAFPLSQVPIVQQYRADKAAGDAQNSTKGGKMGNSGWDMDLEEYYSRLATVTDLARLQETKDFLAKYIDRVGLDGGSGSGGGDMGVSPRGAGQQQRQQPGGRLLCRYTPKFRAISEAGVQLAARTPDEEYKYDPIVGDRPSHNARIGWKPDSYYLYGTKRGVGCEVLGFEKGDVYTVVNFSSRRGYEFGQHGSLITVVSYPPSVDIEEACPNHLSNTFTMGQK